MKKIFRGSKMELDRNKKIVITTVAIVMVMAVAAFVYRDYLHPQRRQIIAYLKKVLNDPGSLKIIDWGKKEPNPNPSKVKWEYSIHVEYSAKNPMGGRVRNTKYFCIYPDGKVYPARIKDLDVMIGEITR